MEVSSTDSVLYAIILSHSITEYLLSSNSALRYVFVYFYFIRLRIISR